MVEMAKKEVGKQEKLDFTHVEYRMDLQGEVVVGGDSTAKF